MSNVHSLRRALPVCAVALLLTATPALAFEPSVLVLEADPGSQQEVTDLGARGGALATSISQVAGQQEVSLAWSTDQGASWPSVPQMGRPTREPQVTVCAGHAAMTFRASYAPGAWVIESYAAPLDGGSGTSQAWSAAGSVRTPDIACIANDEFVVAWFQDSGSGYQVRVRTGEPQTGISGQSFNLGSGTVSRGLAIATSATRVYVAWFQGRDLKLRRFSIGTTGSHSLTSLGTTTIASLRYGYTPRIGADGDRVILAYMDRADLKVRRSGNRGTSFGSAQTLRDEPFPSEIGAYPTTVAVKGSRVAIGAVEIGGIEALVGKGLGYLSTNGGSSYTKVSMHSGGRTVAGLVKIGSGYRYAEAWDQSISQPDPQSVRYRRQ